MESRSEPWDVVVVGAGPVGLMTANLLGLRGVRTLVVEQREELIEFPRGVGMDDETLRTFQCAGLVDQVLLHTVPNQPLVFLDKSNRVLAEMAPSAGEFGWPRRNGFVQPLADRVLLEGLSRFAHVLVAWGTQVEDITQDDSLVTLTCGNADGVRSIQTSYVVGCDGGSSSVRSGLGISFPGESSPADWLVVDLRNDPVGRPGAFVGADPRRPYVSIGIPHGIRRFEFMVMPGETREVVEQPEFIHGLMRGLVARPESVEIIRQRVYTHHSRMAERFSERRVYLAGDAAHIMPVWQGQGYNSGIRDAGNLAWKLADVVCGRSDPLLLDTYELERRDHAAAMTDLSTLVGRVISVTSTPIAAARDLLLRTAGLVPWVKRYFVEMRFKPRPAFTKGAFVITDASGERSTVGTMFMQPRVSTRDCDDVLLDDVLGYRFAVLAWNNDPLKILSKEALLLAERLGAVLVEARPQRQLRLADHEHDAVAVIGDRDGALQAWFQRHPESVVVLRPDRIVAGASSAQESSDMLASVCDAVHLSNNPETVAQAVANA
jgi:3-(3-hydroxy-phenyl)propionate hydroxylase